MTFVNPIFVGPNGMKVSVENGVLDPGKHTVFSLKENTKNINGKASKKNISVDSGKGIYIGKGRDLMVNWILAKVVRSLIGLSRVLIGLSRVVAINSRRMGIQVFLSRSP